MFIDNTDQTSIWMWTIFNLISSQNRGYSWASWHYWTGMGLPTIWTSSSLNMPWAEVQKLQQPISVLESYSQCCKEFCRALSAGGVMLLNSNRIKQCSVTLPGTPELHFLSVDRHCPVLVSSVPHSTFSFSFSQLDACTSPLFFHEATAFPNSLQLIMPYLTLARSGFLRKEKEPSQHVLVFAQLL